MFKWLHKLIRDDKTMAHTASSTQSSPLSASTRVSKTIARKPIVFDTVETARLPSEHLEAESRIYLSKFAGQIIALGQRSAEIRETLAEGALHGREK